METGSNALTQKGLTDEVIPLRFLITSKKKLKSLQADSWRPPTLTYIGAPLVPRANTACKEIFVCGSYGSLVVSIQVRP